jgi:hypothetical protein
MPRIEKPERCYCKYMGFSKSSGYNPCEYCKTKNQNKAMPNISKMKKKKTKKLNLPTKVKKTKSSPVDYYNCLLTSAQND